ncbi:YjfI family protein [Cellvibrio mixtus]|uniref:YjfI family protein n=1 Tax=Cellvibrio mixtus TaxID=39650 RepID=UPI000586C066|nr:YjfI family protein [Cellvibrio mixtus]
MQKKSSAHYQREYRNRLREQGFVKKEVWILPENARRLSLYEMELRVSAKQVVSRGFMPVKGESRMTDVVNRWTTPSLYDALGKSELFAGERAEIELIDGVAPALHITMYEYGDLPLFVTVSGEQIVVEATLWSLSEVTDPALFNETVLRTHKYFPLSTISLDKIDGDDCYHMFGALSSASSLQDIVFEIEILASNVIQATEAYADFLLK